MWLAMMIKRRYSHKMLKGITISPITHRQKNSAAVLLAEAFAKREPVIMFTKLSMEEAKKDFVHLLEDTISEELTLVATDYNGNVKGVILGQSANKMLPKKAFTPIDYLLPREAIITNTKRKWNYCKLYEYYNKLGWLQSKRLFYLTALGVSTGIQGNALGITLQNKLIEMAIAKGFERGSVHCANKHSAKLFSESHLLYKNAYDDFEIELPDGKIKPYIGLNQWYNSVINAERRKQGKVPIYDAAIFNYCFEFALEDELRY
jgi:hypothetical protein